MREIKFRIWNGHGMDADPQAWCESINECLRYADSDVVVMQYTGLKDKNSKEIYEGDVVRDCDTSDCVFEVKWHDKAAGYYMPDEFDEEYAYPMSQVKLQIIGNIYENPELLTKN